jgi:hypothetical protein
MVPSPVHSKWPKPSPHLSPPTPRRRQQLKTRGRFEAEGSLAKTCHEAAHKACCVKHYLNIQEVPCRTQLVTEFELICFLLPASLPYPH